MLKQLLITGKLSRLNAQRSALVGKNAEFAEKRAAMKKREDDLEKALQETTPDTPADDQKAIEEQAEELVQEQNALEQEAVANDQAIADLTTQIEALQSELDDINARLDEEEEDKETPEEEAPADEQAPADEEEKPEEERKYAPMITRSIFGTAANQKALFARDDVKAFVKRFRDARMSKRAVTGGDLLIPEVLLPILRQVAEEASKLMKHVNVKSVPGTSRMNIAGNIPEAVWTEAVGKLNELSLTFNDVELDGYKVGGYFSIPNAILEDAADVDLAAEAIENIGKGIGYAVDKAILYGTGTKMPVGIVTRLAQTAAPADYPATARAWTDLHTSNVLTIASTTKAAELYKAIINDSGVTYTRYAHDNMFWVMNHKTYTTLMAEALSINAAGAIVSGQNMTMPVLGGDIEILDFVPDDNIVFGYGELYLLAERKGTQLATSTDYQFVEDRTVFKGTARYDGCPAIAEAFAVIGINGTAPTTSMTFATDSAN